MPRFGGLGRAFGRMGAGGKVPAAAAAGFSPVNAESTTWKNAVVGDGGSVTDARLQLVDALITSLKGASIFTKMDRLWLFAAENSQSALRDIVAAASSTANGGPTFAANQGYTGTDASSAIYIDSGFNPSTAGGNYTQNAAHIGCWVNADVTTSASGGDAIGVQTVGTTQTNIVPRYSDGKAYYRINDVNASPSAGITTANAAGYYVANRSGAAAQQGYKGAVDQSVVAASSAALTNQNIGILANRTSGGATNVGFGGQLSVVHIGGNLSAQNVTDLNTALATYRTGVGL